MDAAHIKMITLFYIFLVLGLSFVRGIPDDEKAKIMSDMVPHAEACASEHGVNADDVKNAKGTDHIHEMGSCLMGCIYKKIHVIDDKGFFDLEKSKDMYMKYFSNESDKKFISDLIQTCAKVNKETVGDGAKGCDRGKLLNECLMPFQKEFFPMR